MEMSSSDKGVSQCSEAVVDHYGVTFSCLGSSLQKLTTKQEGLAAAVQQEGRTLNEERAQHRVEQMVSITGIYRSKLNRIREEMGTLSARSARLRQRAARLQEAKQKESMEREVQRDKDRVREKELIAKPSSSNST